MSVTTENSIHYISHDLWDTFCDKDISCTKCHYNNYCGVERQYEGDKTELDILIDFLEVIK